MPRHLTQSGDVILLQSGYDWLLQISDPVPPPPPPPSAPTVLVGTAIKLNFRDPRNLEPFNAIDVSGLDAVSIMAKYYAKAGTSNFFNLNPDPRNIVIRVGLNPYFKGRQTYSNLRDTIYRLINASKTGEVKLLFKLDETVVATINGYISKIETSLFEKNQEVQISIKCDDPFLRAPSPTPVNFGAFTFIDDVISDNVSTAPHGFSFQLIFTADTPSLYIVDPTDGLWSFSAVLPGGFLDGDVLHYSNDLSKELYITRGSSVIDIKRYISYGSVWPIIFPGDNRFSFGYPSNLDWLSISYYKTFWGV